MDYVEKSFAAAGETSKLLITLATGVIAFCLTLVNFKIGDKTLLAPTTKWQIRTLEGAVFLFLVSAGTGIWTQLGITQVLTDATEHKPPSTWNRSIVVPFQIQLIAFVLGLAGVAICILKQL